MHTLIDAAFNRSRVILLVLVFLLVAGTVSWINIPKESAPDVTVPIVYVSLNHEGISPDDAERLLIRPMEKELQSVEGLKEMKSTASEGHGSLILTFFAAPVPVLVTTKFKGISLHKITSAGASFVSLIAG